MNLSGFLPKNQASDWLTYLVDQLEAWYLAGKQLELMSWLRILEKIACSKYMYIYAEIDRLWSKKENAIIL